ncbi:MAG: hypothetical protein ACK5MD_08915 [Flavobacteriales bacterium]
MKNTLLLTFVIIIILSSCSYSIDNKNKENVETKINNSYHNSASVKNNSLDADTILTFKKINIDKNEYEKVKYNSQYNINADDYETNKEFLKIKTQKGIQVFKNNVGIPYDEDIKTYSYQGYLEKIKKHIIGIDYYESGEFLLIDNKTGKIDTIPGKPYPSLDLKYLACFSLNPYENDNKLFIYKISSNKIKKNQELSLDNDKFPLEIMWAFEDEIFIKLEDINSKNKFYYQKFSPIRFLDYNSYKDNKDFFIKTFDVNKDGIKDQIVSHNRYQGDELLVFLGDTDYNYNFALKTTNFSQDGGNQISDIEETQEGFKIITNFPNRGHLQSNYYISVTDNTFILTKIKTESYSGQDKYTENCIQNLNLNLKNSKEKLVSTITDTKAECIKFYEDK